MTQDRITFGALDEWKQLLERKATVDEIVGWVTALPWVERMEVHNDRSFKLWVNGPLLDTLRLKHDDAT